MYALLGDIYMQTNSDDIGGFLSSMLHGYYGETTDPAVWNDWEQFLKKIVSERQDNYREA